MRALVLQPDRQHPLGQRDRLLQRVALALEERFLLRLDLCLKLLDLLGSFLGKHGLCRFRRLLGSDLGPDAG